VPLSPFRPFALLLIIAATLPAQALTFGDFTYTDNGTSVTITDYPTTAIGAVYIPGSINGKPVTKIGDRAFYYCSSLSGEMPKAVFSGGQLSMTFFAGRDGVNYAVETSERMPTATTGVRIPNSVTPA
jgi:hypothetical protein